MSNQTLVRTFYKDGSPTGRRVKPSGPPAANIPSYTIIGLLKDVKQGGVDKKTGTERYFNFEQRAGAAPVYNPDTMNIVVRTTQPPESIAGTIRSAVASLDPALPVVKLQSMEDVFAEAIGRPRLLAQPLGLFAGLALLLAAIGRYGVLPYLVTERRREIGIRMALGADRAPVLRMVLTQGLRLTLVGVVIGLAAAFGMTRVLAPQLFGGAAVRPGDHRVVVALIATVAAGGVLPYGACRDPSESDDCVARRVGDSLVFRFV